VSFSWSLKLAAWSGDPEAWSLKLLTIDPDPGAKLGPVIAHDLELSCDGQQLGRRRMFNLYCELFQSKTTIYCFGKCCLNQSKPARTMSQASKRSAPMIVS